MPAGEPRPAHRPRGTYKRGEPLVPLRVRVTEEQLRSLDNTRGNSETRTDVVHRILNAWFRLKS